MRQRKQERREVFSVQPAIPHFLSWSEVANPGIYPLVVDPIIANTRLTKVLMDGGSSLNIIYAQTLDLLGIERMRL
jgi:hypothetical protein